jgi:hypothetical protein
MGQDWRPKKASMVELFILVLEMANLKIPEAISLREKDRWIVFHAYVVICYVLSLHGCEGFLCNLASLHHKFAIGGTHDVVITHDGYRDPSPTPTS